MRGTVTEGDSTVQESSLQGQRAHAHTWRRRVAMTFVVPTMVLAGVLGPAMVPADSAVSAPLAAPAAEAAPSHCLQVARHTYAVSRGNLPAALRALRATRGCGDSLANGICHASRQWWGGWARGTVRFVTYGQYGHGKGCARASSCNNRPAAASRPSSIRST